MKFPSGDERTLERVMPATDLSRAPHAPIELALLLVVVRATGQSKTSFPLFRPRHVPRPRLRGARRRSRPRKCPPERHSASPDGQGTPPSDCERRVVPNSASRTCLRPLAVARARTASETARVPDCLKSKAVFVTRRLVSLNARVSFYRAQLWSGPLQLFFLCARARRNKATAA